MDGSKFIAGVLMGSGLGLPGPDNFEDTNRLGVPLLSQEDVINPELQQAAMVSALDLAVPANITDGEQWPLVLSISEDEPAILSRLPFLIIIATGADVRTTQLPVLKDNLVINLVKDDMPGSGQWYFYAIEVRDYAANLAELVIKSLGFNPANTTRKTSDGTDPKAAIESGKVSKLRYQGQPVQMR